MSAKQKLSSLRILIVEDDTDIAENIADYLEVHGHVLDFAMDGIGGLHLALTQDYNAIVLDIMLPGMDGLTFCRKLREQGAKQTPILMLTARDTLADKLKGFEAGADDYLVKPFELQELEARLGALVRRAGQSRQGHYQVGDLQVDMGKMVVQRAGYPVDLNRTTMKILILLVQAYPNVVSRKKIAHELWGDTPPGSDALRSHIYALRRAIDKPFNRPLIQTVHGVGYRLVETDDLSS